MIKKSFRKGFTLIELLASIAVLAVVLLLVTVSYSKIRKNSLNKQYNNLKTLIEQVSIKYSSKTGAYNFFVQELIDEDYLEPDDEEKVYDPRNKEPLNCHLVSVNDEEPVKATLHEEDHTSNDGTCDRSSVTGLSSDLLLNAVLTGTNIVYTADSTVNSNSVYPHIYNGWTKSNITITADVSRISEDLTDSRIVWNNNPDTTTYYPNVTFTSNESVIYDDFYYADLYLSNDTRYQARLKYKMDNEKPVIYHEKTKVVSSANDNEWAKSKTVVLYVTDKDGVGLDRIYVGPRPCADLLTDRTIGQSAVPGLVQTYLFNDEASATGFQANVCAVDKLGNLADQGNVFISKVDSVPPRVETNVYIFNDARHTDLTQYTETPILTTTNTEIDIASLHQSTGGWTNTGHMYRFNVTDQGSGLIEGGLALKATNRYYADYNEHNVLEVINVAYPESLSTGSTYVYGLGISGKGKRIARFRVCDQLDNCTVVNFLREWIDKDAPSVPQMNFVYGNWTAYDPTKWSNQALYAGRTQADPKPLSTDLGSGVYHYLINNPNDNSQSFVTFAYNKDNALYKMETDNTHTREFKAVDMVGNVSDVKTVTGKIDKTKPTCGSVSGDPGSTSNWKNTNRTITVACSDGTNTSGCVKTSYSKEFTSNATTGTISIADNAGNTQTCTVNVYIDKDKPTCGARTGEGDSNNWINYGRTVSVACNDTGGSTCGQATYSKAFNSEGYRGSIDIYDKAGNKESCDVGVYIDKTPPTVIITTYDYLKSNAAGNYVGNLWKGPQQYVGSSALHDVNSFNNGNNTNYKTFKVEATDSLSGVDDFIHWYRDTKSDNGYSNTTWPTILTGDDSDTFTGTYYNNFNVPGCRKAQVILCDNADNCTNVDITAKISGDGVTANCSGSGGASGGSGGSGNSGGTGTGGTCNLPAAFNSAFLHASSTGVACNKGVGDIRNYGRQKKFGCNAESSSLLSDYNDASYALRGDTCATYSGTSYITGSTPSKVFHDYVTGYDYYNYLFVSTSRNICGQKVHFTNHTTYSMGVRYANSGSKSYQYKCNQYRNGLEFANAYGTAQGTGSSNYYFCCE